MSKQKIEMAGGSRIIIPGGSGVYCAGETCRRQIGIIAGKSEPELFATCNDCGKTFCVKCTLKHTH